MNGVRGKMAKAKKNQFDPNQKQQDQARIIGGKREVFSDLFKLEVSACKVNKSYNDVPDIFDQEHVHWFHTYDSDGKKHMRTNAVSGHFHEIEYEEQGQGKPVKIISVSGPKHEVKRKALGRWKKVSEPVALSKPEVDEEIRDDHTHAITYKKTDIVEVRTQRVEAINAVAAEAQKTAPIPGVQ